MSSTLSDTIETAKNVMESAREGAEHAANSTKHAASAAQDGAGHAVASARNTWWDGIKAVTSILSVLRSFQTGDALGWVGLERRRSPLLSMGMFGAGVAVGAGAGILFAPMSGVAMRRLIVDRITGAPRSETALQGAVQAKDPAVEAAHRAVDRAAAKATHAGDGEASKSTSDSHPA